MAQTAAGRYTADFKIQNYGSYLLKAVHKRNGNTVAESLGSVSLSYPLEYLRSSADPEPLKHAALVSGGSDQAKPAQIWDAAGEKVNYTQDLWPYVLMAVAICSCWISTRSACACSATARSSSSSRVAQALSDSRNG